MNDGSGSIEREPFAFSLHGIQVLSSLGILSSTFHNNNQNFVQILVPLYVPGPPFYPTYHRFSVRVCPVGLLDKVFRYGPGLRHFRVGIVQRFV